MLPILFTSASAVMDVCHNGSDHGPRPEPPSAAIAFFIRQLSQLKAEWIESAKRDPMDNEDV
ncbi:hypothetical protein TcasGA2_TC002833 [Tribolium castaneum]|uniref:Uncharacterized protein n=1 Tax=Tribolium castaneum TaxID=7070 RepID=D6WI79_TRICA|nr:hypothetical protein TcasGA2_TC002833 [Tribolium castaneum]